MAKIAGAPEGFNGEESGHSPLERTKSILGVKADRATVALQATDDGILKVAPIEGVSTSSLLHTGSASAIAAATPTTVTTFVAGAATVVRKVLVSTDASACDFELRKNGSDIGIKRTNGDLNVEFEFKQGLSLAVLETLSVVVDHCVTGKLKKFDMYVYGE